MKIVFASSNDGKLKEIKEILSNYDILSLKDINCDIEISEDQDSFYLNALKKAKEIYSIIKIPVIADDSGLCIKDLDMWPGVMTKRFFNGNQSDRNQEIINRVNKISNRDALFICSLVYYDGKNIIAGKGTIEGSIAKKPRGDKGFGFDPIFVISNGKTLAEISERDKNKCSARYLAAIDLKDKLSN